MIIGSVHISRFTASVNKYAWRAAAVRGHVHGKQADNGATDLAGRLAGELEDRHEFRYSVVFALKSP